MLQIPLSGIRSMLEEFLESSIRWWDISQVSLSAIAKENTTWLWRRGKHLQQLFDLFYRVLISVFVDKEFENGIDMMVLSFSVFARTPALPDML